MSWFSDFTDAAFGWTREIDPSSRSNAIGRAVGSGGREFFRQAAGTVLFFPTAGGYLVPGRAGQRIREYGMRGFQTGAAAGLAGGSKNPAGAALAGARQIQAGANVAESRPTGTGAFQPPTTQGPAFDFAGLFKNPIVLVVVALLALAFLSGGGERTVIREVERRR